ncbi:MAG: hypothetical protein MHM6MM_001612 [Cercozoa sp. M6MM]
MTGRLADFLEAVYFDGPDPEGVPDFSEHGSLRQRLFHYTKAVYETIGSDTFDSEHMYKSFRPGTDSYFATRSLALFVGALPLYVESLAGMTADEMFEDIATLSKSATGTAKQLEVPQERRRHSVSAASFASLATCAEYHADLWNSVQHVHKSYSAGHEHLEQQPNAVVHRMIATASRYLLLPDNTCMELRSAANKTALYVPGWTETCQMLSSWWGAADSETYKELSKTFFDNLATAWQNHKTTVELTNCMGAVSDKSKQVFRLENIVRIASCSTVMEQMRTFGVAAKSVEGLSDLRLYRTPVDVEILRDLSKIGRETVPRFYKAKNAPLFELSMLAVAQRQSARCEDKIWFRDKWELSQAAQLVLANIKRTLLQCFLSEMESSLIFHQQHGVGCSAFATNDRVFFSCFQNEVKHRLVNVFFVNETAKEETETFVQLLQCANENCTELETADVSVSYAIGMMSGVQGAESIRRRRLFRLAETAVLPFNKTESVLQLIPDNQEQLLSAACARSSEPVAPAASVASSLPEVDCATVAAVRLLQEVNAGKGPAQVQSDTALHQQGSATEFDLAHKVAARLRASEASDQFTAAHKMLEPVRKAFNVDVNLIADEVRSIRFGSGGTASLS